MKKYYPNPTRTHKNKADKLRDFDAACQAGEMAFRDGDLSVSISKLQTPLTQFSVDDVEFIGGHWRVQTHAYYDVRQIRDQKFIIGPRINIAEKNYFEYYQIAEIPQFNCYGPVSDPKFNMVAAHYKTDHGEYWGYGTDVASARAFLGIRLYDEYMDLIHAHACKNQTAKKR